MVPIEVDLICPNAELKSYADYQKLSSRDQRTLFYFDERPKVYLHVRFGSQTISAALLQNLECVVWTLFGDEKNDDDSADERERHGHIVSTSSWDGSSELSSQEKSPDNPEGRSGTLEMPSEIIMSYDEQAALIPINVSIGSAQSCPKMSNTVTLECLVTFKEQFNSEESSNQINFTLQQEARSLLDSIQDCISSHHIDKDTLFTTNEELGLIKGFVSKSYPIMQAFSAQVQIVKGRKLPPDTFFLQVDMENITSDILEILDVNVDIPGAFAEICGDSVGHGKVMRLVGEDVCGFLFQVLIDNTLTSHSHLSSASISELLTGTKVSVASRRCFEDLRGLPMQSTWFLGRDDFQLNSLSPTLSPKSQSEDSRIFIEFSVSTDVHIHKTFPVRVQIINKSSIPANLTITIPKPNFNEKKMNELSKWRSIQDVSIPMDPLDLLSEYDTNSRLNPSIICLEREYRIRDLQAQTSHAFFMHMVAVRGAGTQQKIQQICVRDEDTETEHHLEDVLEIWIHSTKGSPLIKSLRSPLLRTSLVPL